MKRRQVRGPLAHGVFGGLYTAGTPITARPRDDAPGLGRGVSGSRSPETGAAARSCSSPSSAVLAPVAPGPFSLHWEGGSSRERSPWTMSLCVPAAVGQKGRTEGTGHSEGPSPLPSRLPGPSPWARQRPMGAGGGTLGPVVEAAPRLAAPAAPPGAPSPPAPRRTPGPGALRGRRSPQREGLACCKGFNCPAE